MITVLAVLAMAIGLAGVVRAVHIVATGDVGRFPLDPWVSLVTGFALILLGQALLRA
jgi:hypothetical protein